MASSPSGSGCGAGPPAASAAPARDAGAVVARDLRLRRPPRPDQRVDDVVEALAEQREAGHESDDRDAREQAGPPDPGAGVVDRPLQVVAPLGRVGRLDPVAEEAEGGERQDRVGGVQRRQRGHVLDHVLEDVAADDRPPRRPERARRLDVGLLADADHVVADDAEVLRHVDGGDRDRRGDDPLAELVGEQEGDHDREQDVGEGEERVHDQDEHAVERGRRRSRRRGRAGRRSTSEKTTARTTTSIAVRAPQIDPREHVVAADGGPEQVGAVGRRLLREAAGGVGRPGRSRRARCSGAKIASRTKKATIPTPLQKIQRETPGRVADRRQPARQSAGCLIGTSPAGR